MKVDLNGMITNLFKKKHWLFCGRVQKANTNF
jgi:hypothetical protein